MNKAEIQWMIDNAPPSWLTMFKRYGLGKKPTVDKLINTVLEYSPTMRSSGERGKAEHKVPAKVRKEAAKGLELAYIHDYTSASGIGLVRAMQLVVKDKIWQRSIERMKAYFTRHEVDKQGKHFGDKKKPSRGYIAWLAWGGDSGFSWAKKMVGSKQNPRVSKRPLTNSKRRRNKSGVIIGRDWNAEYVRTSKEIADARKLLVQRPVDRKSPAFKRWFQNSVVKSKHRGVPTIVYRGTADVRNFVNTGEFRGSRMYLGYDVSDRAYFFSDNARIAKTYATDKMAHDYRNAIPAVGGFYLRIQNPLIVDGQGQSFRKTEKFIKEAYELGHDGLIIENTLDGYNVGLGGTFNKPSTVYVVFDLKNVKLANGREEPYEEVEDTRKNPRRRRNSSMNYTVVVQYQGQPEPVYYLLQAKNKTDARRIARQELRIGKSQGQIVAIDPHTRRNRGPDIIDLTSWDLPFRKGSRVQTIIFDRKLFNGHSARAWLRKHNFKTPKTEKTANFLRYRQSEPKMFHKDSFRTLEFKKGIKAVVAIPVKNPKRRRNRWSGDSLGHRGAACKRWEKEGPTEGCPKGSSRSALVRYRASPRGQAAQKRLIRRIERSSRGYYRKRTLNAYGFEVFYYYIVAINKKGNKYLKRVTQQVAESVRK